MTTVPGAPSPDEGARSRLSADDHESPKGERTLVYPVDSRRAGGLSVGVNLNPGKECNWACVYCEVQGLVRGAPGAIELDVLEDELNGVIADALAGRWAPGEMDGRSFLKDISIAGDGEPTLSPSFREAVEICADVRRAHGLEESTSLVVITNGSQAHREDVRRGWGALSVAGGEAWFKLDAGDREKRLLVNRVEISDERIIQNLVTTSTLVPTFVQTMAVAPHSDPLGVGRLLRRAVERGAKPLGVLLYGMRRPSCQPGGADLEILEEESLQRAARILEDASGLSVRVFR